ncbi:MAG: carbohydrate binding family 9 domain-containing protein [Candidatus Marinimicrobia bacterium]|nr:carbohydrate binding family 9 domain-containing protein [Candidatus Neomarinimicrobiota bacterium]
MKRAIIFVMLVFIPCFIKAKLTIEELDTFRLRETSASLIKEQKIIIDGELDEAIWQSGNWQGNFIQRDPNDGSPETYKTEFCVFYDSDYLYVGAKAHDPEPDKIIAILTRRDSYSQSDWMYVSLDSYNDNRTAFEFGINAAGVKHDLRRFDDTNADDDWNAVWEGKSHINDEGWTAEWRIPFRELRFTSNGNMQWGFQMYRELPRHNSELSVWSYWSHSEEGFVSQYGALTGLQNISVKNPVYIAPFVAGQANVSKNLVNPVHEKNYDLLSNVGADIRYSSPKGLTFNATINPDFGQVEADPADFNLTEFETYFRENRPFFMEGGNILRFSLGFGDGDAQFNNLFYSRRIGRSPQGWVPEDDDKEVITTSYPDRTNILGAAKLTGKTTNGLSIGVMEAVTSEETGKVFYEDDSRQVGVIEPLSNYWLSRVQQDFNDGQTSIGGIFTAVNRKLDDTGIDYLHKAAYTGGIDIDHEFLDRKYGFQGAIAFSNVRADTTAIQGTQMSSARYYNRVDADYLEYDPLRTSLSGYAVKAILTKNTGNIRAATGGMAFSPGFEINDMGFLRQVDDVTQFTWVQYRKWEDMERLRSFQMNFNQWSVWNFNGDRRNIGGNINMHFDFNNNWGSGFGINKGWGGLDPAFNRGGPAMQTPDNWNLWGYANTDGRKKVILQMEGFYFQSNDDVIGIGIEPEITWRPKQNIQLTAGVEFNNLKDTWAWIGKAEDENGETQYIWSSMDQKTFSMVLRADLTLTPTLSIQYFAQPFFTAGEYFDLMRVNDSYAKDYNKRFEKFGDDISYNYENDEYEVDKGNDGIIDYTFEGQTDFNYKQLRSNLVLRWEYLTGSAIYLVWSQGFTDYESFKPFDIPRDTRTLFDTDGDNVFMIKISHMLNI